MRVRDSGSTRCLWGEGWRGGEASEEAGRVQRKPLSLTRVSIPVPATARCVCNGANEGALEYSTMARLWPGYPARPMAPSCAQVCNETSEPAGRHSLGHVAVGVLVDAQLVAEVPCPEQVRPHHLVRRKDTVSAQMLCSWAAALVRHKTVPHKASVVPGPSPA